MGLRIKTNRIQQIGLTSRQVEYLALVALGCKNPVISKLLIVSKSTVKKTLEKIFDKLKAKDRANAVTLGFLHQILTLPELTYISNLYNLPLQLPEFILEESHISNTKSTKS